MQFSTYETSVDMIESVDVELERVQSITQKPMSRDPDVEIIWRIRQTRDPMTFSRLYEVISPTPLPYTSVNGPIEPSRDWLARLLVRRWLRSNYTCLRYSIEGKLCGK